MADGIFLGYSTSSKAFRVFNKITLCVKETPHVIFDESVVVSDNVESVSKIDEFELTPSKHIKVYLQKLDSDSNEESPLPDIPSKDSNEESPLPDKEMLSKGGTLSPHVQ